MDTPKKRGHFGLAGAVALLGAVVFTAAAARAFLIVPGGDLEVGSRAATRETPVYAGDAPSRLIIPKIGVDAGVQHTGIAKSGSMAVPTSYYEAGWYRLGPTPGEAGSAVMAGHVDNGAGLPAVFSRLEELEIGDSVYVETGSGERLRFEVVALETYRYDEAPLERIFGAAGEARLNLITCEGQWITDKKMYDERRVVYTVFRGSR